MNNPQYLTSILALVVTSLLSAPANAERLTEALNECRQQQNALKRLVCYDEFNVATTSTKPAAPGKINAAEAKTTAAQAQPASDRPSSVVSAPAPVATDDFGLEHRKAADSQAEQLYLTVSGISYGARKELIVEFENGQIWRQTSSGSYPIAVGERHYIKRGMLNSFTLGNDSSNRTTKVRRVQ